MAISATSGSTISQSLWQQLQLQQVQRTATEAEQRARSLQKQADDAQAEADQAQENARQLGVKASQAQTTANQAAQNLAVAQSSGQYQAQLGNASTQISQGIQSAQSLAQGHPVSNSQGQTIGTVVNVTA
jgi:Skp family chaperone for outer membrane proteins